MTVLTIKYVLARFFFGQVFLVFLVNKEHNVLRNGLLKIYLCSLMKNYIYMSSLWINCTKFWNI